ncbi:ABC transporter substrate-binding protein [Piscinibacter defluvii]|uniref:ABC transporter substrate-binding protein n=1 Tax=Piscinibacter defluvii TaxID=1796922 RepID=UPI000FDF1F11|nr:ABC transporter substrate-binding protein [Piscinibacter defluvii]
MKTRIPRTLLAAALLAAFGTAVQAQSTITITSYGGAYGKSLQEVMYKPFAAKSGVKVLSEDYNGGLAEVRAQVKTGNVKWDVIDVELAEALRGCDEGLFEKIDPVKLPPGEDGTPAKSDFVPGAITPCAVGTITYANVVAYDKAKYPSNAPKTLDDFFDLKKFPGKRGMKKEAPVNLEWALMADGVAPQDVYKVLSTPAGVDRAFKKLDTIKPQIVWWTAGAQPPQLLAAGEVALTTVYHGRIYDANTKDKRDFALVWDGQVVVPNLFAVVKGSKNVAPAMEFVRFATSSKPLADETGYIPYAPMRKSSLKLVADSVKPWLPGTSQHGRHLQTDAAWWADHGDEMNQRFAAWLAK